MITDSGQFNKAMLIMNSLPAEDLRFIINRAMSKAQIEGTFDVDYVCDEILRGHREKTLPSMLRGVHRRVRDEKTLLPVLNSTTIGRARRILIDTAFGMCKEKGYAMLTEAIEETIYRAKRKWPSDYAHVSPFKEAKSQSTKRHAGVILRGVGFKNSRRYLPGKPGSSSVWELDDPMMNDLELVRQMDYLDALIELGEEDDIAPTIKDSDKLVTGVEGFI